MNKNFKIGDKLLCKKAVKSRITVLTEGDYYIIKDITHKDGYNCHHIECNNHEIVRFNTIYMLYEWFYTKIEERKMKLEKIYNYDTSES